MCCKCFLWKHIKFTFQCISTQKYFSWRIRAKLHLHWLMIRTVYYHRYGTRQHFKYTLVTTSFILLRFSIYTSKWYNCIIIYLSKFLFFLNTCLLILSKWWHLVEKKNMPSNYNSHSTAICDKRLQRHKTNQTIHNENRESFK